MTAFFGIAIGVGLSVGMSIYPEKGCFFTAIMVGASIGVIISHYFLLISGTIFCKINGAPFHEGDSVKIMAGKYTGQITKVYEVWEERKEVCVDLGEQAKEEAEDIFSYILIRRVKDDAIR